MARLAIFIDGTYASKIAKIHFDARLDYAILSQEIETKIGTGMHDPLDLLRNYYYDCLPYQDNPPTPKQVQLFQDKRRFLSALDREKKFKVRLGRLAYRGTNADGDPVYQQKKIDMMIGLDIATLAIKRQITHAAILTGDSDFLPAVELAQGEGVQVWLVHGPKETYASELWSSVDDRLSIGEEPGFLDKIKRRKTRK